MNLEIKMANYTMLMFHIVFKFYAFLIKCQYIMHACMQLNKIVMIW